ncbi:hypothetical protein ACVWY0_002590 [Arthrobacter sp. UYNi723]
MLGVHGSHHIIKGLARWPDARLNTKRKFDVGQGAGGLELAEGAGSGGSQGGTLPQLGRQEKDGPLPRAELDIGQAVRFLADAVAGGGRIIFAPAEVRDGFHIEAELPEVILVPLKHPAEGHVVAGRVMVDLRPQLCPAQAVFGVQQGYQEVQQAFSTGDGHAGYVTKLLRGKQKARQPTGKQNPDCYRAFRRYDASVSGRP